MPDPIIFQQNSPAASPSRKTWLGRILLALVLVLVGYGVYLAANRIGAPVDTIATSPLPISNARVILMDSQSARSINQPINVDIRIFTGGRTIQGADLLITFDPNQLQFTPGAFFSPGDIFSEYPIAAVDSTTGQIRISGIASASKIGFNGVGAFGRLNFVAKQTGIAKLVVEYAPGNTTDSNMIEYGSGDDVLGQSTSLEIKVN